MIGENKMKVFLLIILALQLSACGSDDESEEAANEPLQLSFTSKPTDKQVLSFLRKKGRSDIELSDNAGRNSTYELRKRWQRGFAYIANANIEEFPDATVKVGGLVQFQINGQNYDFDMVKPLTTQVLGLDIPKEKVLLDLIQKNMEVALPGYRDIVFQEPKITLAAAEIREEFWYTPNSFKVKFDINYSAKAGSNQVETTQCLRGLRFYRDEVKEPFNRIIGELNKCKVLETKQYSRSDFDNLPTLESIQKEKQAQAELAKLVDIKIPDFKDENEAIRFVYKTLYKADKETAKSLMMKIFHDVAFIKDSHAQISGEGQRIMRALNHSLFYAEVTFSQSYCPQMFVKKLDRGIGEFWDALKKSKLRISIHKSGGKMVRGKMVGEKYKLTNLEIYTISRKDDIKILKSWPLDELCEETARKVEVF